VRCSVLQCVAVCLQCVAVCCSVLQCGTYEKRHTKENEEYERVSFTCVNEFCPHGIEASSRINESLFAYV